MEKESKESALWHSISEQEKHDIKESAKKIMDSFAGALAEIEKKAPDFVVERAEHERQEKEPWQADSDFRNIMFKNAPKTKGDCIEAEKGGWAE